MKQKALPAFGMGGVFPSRCSAPNVEVIDDFKGNGWGVDHHATRRRERPMRWLEICSKSRDDLCQVSRHAAVSSGITDAPSDAFSYNGMMAFSCDRI